MEEKLDEILEEIRNNRHSVRLEVPNLDFLKRVEKQIEELPQTLKREVDARQRALVEDIGGIVGALPAKWESNGSPLVQSVLRWRAKVEATLSRAHWIVELVGHAVVVGAVLVLLVLLANLATNVALLTTRRSLRISLPLIAVVVVAVLAALVRARPRTKARPPSSAPTPSAELAATQPAPAREAAGGEGGLPAESYSKAHFPFLLWKYKTERSAS